MQSMFRLPWCGDNRDQFKLSEKARLDKMRPSPVVEIPNMLQHIKRKRSNADTTLPPIAPSPKKLRPEVAIAQQLPTPTSPFMNGHVRNHLQADTQLQAPQAHSTLPAGNGSNILKDSQAQAAPSAPQSTNQEDHTPKAEPTAAAPSDDYFAPRTAHDMASNNLPDQLSGLTPLQQTIENEFNMQILMKHNELRLIEQELAKCQIALEQLRRCELRPYPGTSQPELSVSEGRGAAVAPPPGFSRPSHPAPYGVTDGPYARHYRQWLLHDSQFDSISAQSLAQAEYLANTAGRATRNNGQHHSRPASKSFKGSTRGSDAQLAIPNYPSPVPVKDKNAPLVLRRSTDNKLVKLICNDCKRGNFSSIQGFLNHCRIAHKVDYKSHDQAACGCGQELDEQELANLPPETHATPVSKPSHAPSRSVSHPTITVPKASSTFVHPLNTPAATPINTPKPTPPYKANNPRPIAPALPAKSGSLSSNFKPSGQAPRLSDHFAKHNLGGDLEQAIANAKAKVDFSADEDMQTPDTPDIMSPALPFQGGARMPSGTTHLAAANGTERPVSRKGFRQPTQQRPRPAPLAPALPPGMHMHDSTLSSPQDATMSPHSADNAPGLVSDHEDDDNGSPSDDEEHSTLDVASRPLAPVGRSCGDDPMELDVQTDDEIDQHGVIIRRNSMIAQEAREIRSAGSPSRKLAGK